MTEHAIQVDRPSRRRRAILAGVAWLVIAPILFVAIGKAVGPAGGGPPGWLGYALMAIEAAGLLPAAWVHRSARSSAVARCDEGGVTLVVDGAEQRIPVGAIQSALVIEDGGRARLELQLEKDEALTLRFSSPGDAHAALEALRLETRQRAERIPLYNESSRLLNQVGGGVLGGIIGGVPAFFFGASAGALGVLFAALCLVPFALLGASVMTRLLPGITIGADGVSFSTTSDSTRRFVAYRDVDHFSLSERDIYRLPKANVIDLVEKNGKRTQIVFFDKSQRQLAESLYQRLLDAVEERKERGGEKVAPLTDLEARGEPVAEWLARLQKLARRDDGYRTEAIDDARVDAILADGAASPEQRVGAAMLLRIRDQAQGRDRIRIASEACADPAARDALLAVAEANAEEEALDAAARRIR